MIYFVRIQKKKTYLATEEQARLAYGELAVYGHISNAERGIKHGIQTENSSGSLRIWGETNTDQKLLFIQMLSGEVARWNLEL